MSATVRRAGAAVDLVDLVGVEPVAGIVGPRRVFRASWGGAPVVVKMLEVGSVAPAALALDWIGHAAPTGPELAVPTVLCIGDDERVLVTTELAGTPLAELLAPRRTSGTEADQVATIARVGTALAELHRRPAGPLPVTSIDDHLRDLIDPHPSALARDEPAWASTIHAALGALGALDHRPAAHAPIHRDFHARQVLVGDRIGIVDWDLAGAGDPLLDVATFATYLETHGWDPDGRLVAAFLDAYQSGAGDAVDPTRLAAYRIFNLLRRASRRHRLRDAGWAGGWRPERDRMLATLADAVKRCS